MDAQQMLSELQAVPAERFSAWDQNFLQSVEAKIRSGEELSDRWLEKLQTIFEDRTRPLDENGNYADVASSETPEGETT